MRSSACMCCMFAVYSLRPLELILSSTASCLSKQWCSKQCLTSISGTSMLICGGTTPTGSAVCMPLMSSTSFMTGTGFMKCIPTWTAGQHQRVSWTAFTMLSCKHNLHSWTATCKRMHYSRAPSKAYHLLRVCCRSCYPSNGYGTCV